MPDAGLVIDIAEVQLIVAEIGFSRVRPLLQYYNLEALDGEFLRHHTFSCPNTHKNEVNLRVVFSALLERLWGRDWGSDIIWLCLTSRRRYPMIRRFVRCAR